MNTPDHLFLVIYDRPSGRSTVEDLGHDLGRAMQTYAAREREIDGDGSREVVLIGAPSLAALRRTHSSYFGASSALAAVLSSAE